MVATPHAQNYIDQLIGKPATEEVLGKLAANYDDALLVTPRTDTRIQH